jgi:SET domain-containing protein
MIVGLMRLGMRVHCKIFHFRMLSIRSCVIDALDRKFVNHSCSPNCSTREDSQGILFSVARKSGVKKGEELTIGITITSILGLC